MKTLVVNPPIRIEGNLVTSALRNLTTELRMRLANSRETVTLEINSYGGNALQSQALFTEFITYEMRIACRIVMAGSAAALLALLGHERSMYHAGIFGIHLGSVEVESNELQELGGISAISMSRILHFRDFYIEMLEQRTRLPQSAWTTLHASNKLILDAKKCLEYGIVQELF